MSTSRKLSRTREVVRRCVEKELDLLDLRSPEDYAAKHLANATAIPAAELRFRTAELPPPPVDLALLASAEQAGVARTIFARPDGSPSGWRVVATLDADDERLWADAVALGALRSGTASRRLWEPSPHLERAVDAVESTACSRSVGMTVQRRRVLDLGCGKGRDCVWLAQRGWDVVGIDNQRCFVSHLEQFARRSGLDDRVEAVLSDLRDVPDGVGGELLSRLLADPLDMVNVSRFMHRRLLDFVWQRMPVGCWLAVHHFLEGAVSLKSGKRIKPSSEDERSLRPGELRERFSSATRRADIVLDEAGTSADGRPMWSFVCQKIS